MRLYSSISAMPALAGSCVTIGNFDGVHLGHQSLISRAREISQTRNLDFVLITFWPHPRIVLAGPGAHRPLAGRGQRLELLARFGVATILELPFTPDLAALPAADFVRDYLVPLNLRELVIGHDFTLGKGRQGNVDFLREQAKTYGFNLERLAPLMFNEKPISSTRLRQCIEEGDVREARRLLGRPYTVCGNVIHGEGRGTGLGFPTANLQTWNSLLPANGIYATYAICDGMRYKAATSIGTNPTFGGKNISVESFLLDCERNMYGEKLCLEFIARLRSQRAFATPADLAQQIERDVEEAKAILGAK